VISNGWRRADWDNDVEFEEWVRNYLPMPLFYEATEQIKSNGLHAKMAVKYDPFFRIELEPLEGWTWLCAPNRVEAYYQTSWRPHITLASSDWSWRDFKVVFDRYHDVKAVIKIHRISGGGTAVLAYEGIGADVDLWRIYIEGDQGFKWKDNGFGLHISM
jgi:hypothetical protein